MHRDMEEQKFAKRSRSSSNGSTSFRAFNASEAKRIVTDRWRQANNRVSDMSLPADDRPQTYRAPASSGSAWGKPSLHLQAPIDFPAEVKAAIARNRE